MIRARHVTPGQTAARADRLRALVIALQERQLMRDEIGELLQVGPSGVRKYVKDLGDKIEIARHVDGNEKFIGFPVYRLAMTPDQTQSYLATLAAAPAARQVKPANTALRLAARDPSRHFHLMLDDVYFAPRLHRKPVARDPLVAAFFGSSRMEARP